MNRRLIFSVRPVWCFGALLWVLAGCGANAGKDAGSDSAGSTATAAAVSSGAPVSDDESEAFATAFEKAIGSGDIAAANRLFDWDALLATSTSGIEAPKQARESFSQGFKERMAQGGILAEICRLMQKGGTYTHLRVHDRDGERRVLFRMVMPDEGGFNYHDLVLARRPDGKVRAVDLYIFLSAEKLSQTLRRVYLPVAADLSRNVLAKLTGISGDERVYVENLTKVDQMSTLIRENKFAEAQQIYDGFPPVMKKDKNVLLMRLQALQHGDEAAYGEAIGEFRKNYPNDPCVNILSIDYFLVKKQYDRALDCIDRVDKSVGGDPYMNVLRANLLVAAARFDDAKRACQKAIDGDPTLLQAYTSMLGIAVQRDDHPLTLAMLKELRDRFEVQFNNLETIDLYSRFVKSPQYKEWLELQPKGTGPGKAEEKTTPAGAP